MLKQVVDLIGQLFRWWVLVAPWEQAIRVRAGHHVRLLAPGIYLTIPFVDRLYRQSVRRRLVLIPPQTLTTKDGKAVTVGSCVGFEIVDLLKLYNTLHDVQDTITSEVAALTAAFVTAHTLAELENDIAVEPHLEPYGLGKTEFYVTNFASVRTLRLITGDFQSWTHAKALDVTRYDGEPKD